MSSFWFRTRDSFCYQFGRLRPERFLRLYVAVTFATIMISRLSKQVYACAVISSRIRFRSELHTKRTHSVPENPQDGRQYGDQHSQQVWGQEESRICSAKPSKSLQVRKGRCADLFLFYFVLFCFMSFRFILFNFVLSCLVLFSSLFFVMHLFCFVLFCSVPFSFVLYYFILFIFSFFCSFLFCRFSPVPEVCNKMCNKNTILTIPGLVGRNRSTPRM